MALPDRYTKPAMVFHWTIAALIIANLLLIWTLDYYPKDWMRPAIDLHKSFGLTVLGLAVMRVLWRATHAPPPDLPAPKIQHAAAHLAHLGLYLLIFAIPLTGYMADSAYKEAATFPLKLFGVVPFPRVGWIMAIAEPDKEALHKLFFHWHGLLATVLYGLFTVHVLGALKHQWISKQRELQRMWS